MIDDIKTIDFIIDEDESIDFVLDEEEQMDFEMEGYQIIATGDYNELINKPSYNGVVWEGNKTFNDMGDFNLTNLEIKTIFDRVFSKGE